jgi:hypothetical protein
MGGSHSTVSLTDGARDSSARLHGTVLVRRGGAEWWQICHCPLTIDSGSMLSDGAYLLLDDSFVRCHGSRS